MPKSLKRSNIGISNKLLKKSKKKKRNKRKNKVGGMNNGSLRSSTSSIVSNTSNSNIEVVIKTIYGEERIRVDPTKSVRTTIIHTLKLPPTARLRFGDIDIDDNDSTFMEYGIENLGVIEVPENPNTITLNILLSSTVYALGEEITIRLVNVPINTTITIDELYNIQGWPYVDQGRDLQVDTWDDEYQITTGGEDMDIVLDDVTLKRTTGPLSRNELENIARRHGWVPELFIELDYRKKI